MPNGGEVQGEPSGRTVAIAGGSGVVGGRALEQLLGRDDVARVVAVGRRPLPGTHPKLDARTAAFDSVRAIAAELPSGLDAGLCALGTTLRRAGSRQAFRAVDLDAVVAFAEAVRFRGADRFVVVSSVGADPGSWSFYLRVKGEMEAALRDVGFDHLTLVRPSLLDDQGAREEKRLGERLALVLARPLFALLGRTRRHAPVPAAAVGRAMVRLVLDDSTERVRIVESEALHRFRAPTDGPAERPDG